MTLPEQSSISVETMLLFKHSITHEPLQHPVPELEELEELEEDNDEDELLMLDELLPLELLLLELELELFEEELKLLLDDDKLDERDEEDELLEDEADEEDLDEDPDDDFEEDLDEDLDEDPEELFELLLKPVEEDFEDEGPLLSSLQHLYPCPSLDLAIKPRSYLTLQ